MSVTPNRVVRRLQQRLADSGFDGPSEPWSVWLELEARVRRLQGLGDEYSGVCVSDDVLRMCTSGSLRCTGVA